jgi:hypothetical protein
MVGDLLQDFLASLHFRKSPVTLPAGSMDMASFGPHGTSVGGRIVLPPRFSTLSSVVCRSSTWGYANTRLLPSWLAPTPLLILSGSKPVSTTPYFFALLLFIFHPNRSP